MLSTLVTAWRTTIKRLVSDWLIAAAAFITIALAIALLASGPIYADAVTSSALQRTLADAPVTESNLTVRISVFPDYFAEADKAVRDTVASLLDATGADVFSHIEADAFGLADQPADEAVSLLSFQYFEGIADRASLVSGRWPGQSGPPYETALNQPAADALGIDVGDEIEVANRRDPDFGARIVVVGTYQVDDPTDPYWFQDRLALQGQVESTSFRTFGPFVVDLETMSNGFTPLRVDSGWRVLPRYEELTVAEVRGFRSSVSALPDALDSALFGVIDQDDTGTSGFTVTTGLPLLLGDVDHSLTVTRSSVLALLIQLALLAGYALVLTAGLIADTRRTETILLRSRGTSPGQILTTSVLEGLTLILPALLLGPYLATWFLGILNSLGPLAAIDLRIDPTPTREAFVLSALAGSLALVLLAWPAFRSARRFPEGTGRSRRQRRESATQRVGVDIALVLLAAVAFWQLSELGPQISARVRGRFGIDPLLVIAPALGLLAGAVLALRVVPLLARLAEWLATAGRSTVGALASWQVARRPVRYARSALLLMIAVSIGVFAASYSTTWIRSQRDQAQFANGADVTTVPNRAVAHSLSDLVLVSAHLSIPGVESSMPVSQTLGQLSRSAGLGQFMILDAAKAPEVVTIRDDLAPDFDDLMAQLRAGRPTIASATLPGEPVAIVLSVEADEVPLGPDDLPDEIPPNINVGLAFDGQVRLIVQDGNDQLHRIVVGTIPVNQGPQDMRIDLVETLGDGLSAHPTYPLRIVNIEIRSLVPFGFPRSVRLSVRAIEAEDDSGARAPLTTALSWSAWGTGSTVVPFVNESPSIRPAPDGEAGALEMDIGTGEGFGTGPVFFSIRPNGASLPTNYPVVVTESFLTTGFAGVGDTIGLPPLGIDGAAGRIVGVLAAFPTLDPSVPGVIVDLPTYQMLGYEPAFGLEPVSQYWLSTDLTEPEAVAALQTPPISSFKVSSTSGLVSRLVSDPVALGTIGALTVGFVAAAVFAAVGFAVSATVSARERLTEFALLRALGLSPSQLKGWLILEQGALVTVSLALGTLIGGVLTALILPLVTLTQDGRPASPEVIVHFPWPTILTLELAMVVVLGVIVFALATVLRRVGLGSILRMGDE